LKIISRDKLLGMPSGTVYCLYNQGSFHELQMKGDTLPSGNDWYTASLVMPIDDCLDTVEAVEHGEGVDLDFYTECRDGMFEYDQQYAVMNANEMLELGQLIVDSANEIIRTGGDK